MIKKMLGLSSSSPLTHLINSLLNFAFITSIIQTVAKPRPHKFDRYQYWHFFIIKLSFPVWSDFNPHPCAISSGWRATKTWYRFLFFSFHEGIKRPTVMLVDSDRHANNTGKPELVGEPKVDSLRMRLDARWSSWIKIYALRDWALLRYLLILYNTVNQPFCIITRAHNQSLV